MYTDEEAMAQSLAYFNGDELAANVFVTKYALRNKKGELLEANPEHMHRRLAKEFARIEKKKFKDPMTEDEIFRYLDRFERIIPQGSPMYGIGNPYQYVTLSNCYVLPAPHDSYLGINYLDTQIAQISSRRGGCGWPMSTLRPKDVRVSNAAGSTTGVVSFMHRYSNTIREVCQSGRRGASLQSLDVRHPQISDFINCKNNDTDITGSNISVQFNDGFMDCIINGHTQFQLQWPVTQNKNAPVVSIVDPQKIWEEFINATWSRAEPGAIFMDTVLRRSTSAVYPGFEEIAPNPCGEQYLPAYGCCRLICINLYTYVKNRFTDDAYFDGHAFVHDVRIMQRLADDMVDLDIECVERIIDKINKDPEPQEVKQIGIDLWTKIKERSIADRRTGCGIVGLGDCLAALNMKYGSDDSIKQCDSIFKMFKLAAYESSVEMAKELGAFPVYDYELDKKSEFIQELDEILKARMKKHGRRNMTLLTIAPTGSVSILTQTTSGIEPVFKLDYTRRKKINPSEKNVKVDYVDKSGDKWSEHLVYHKGLLDWGDANPDGHSLRTPYHGSTSHEIDYVQKIKLQATIQKHIDNSISVTTNLPADITKEKVAELYLLAYKLGCKGFTIYRDGCRSGVLISKEEKQAKFTDDRPRELPCDVHHITIKGQQYFVLVGLVDGRPYEVFAGKNGFLPPSIKSGIIIRKRKDFYKAVFDDAEEELSPITATTNEMEECITRLTSGLLRVGADMHFVVRQLEKVGERQADMHSFARSVSRALKKYIPNNTKESGTCKECDAEALIRQDGCIMCTNCGHSKCG